jgi:hypothetical protein
MGYLRGESWLCPVSPPRLSAQRKWRCNSDIGPNSQPLILLLLHRRPILQLLQHSRLSRPMGQPDNPRHRALLRHDLPSRVTPLARPQGPLGRMPLRAHSRPQKRESAQSICNA